MGCEGTTTLSSSRTLSSLTHTNRAGALQNGVTDENAYLVLGTCSTAAADLTLITQRHRLTDRQTYKRVHTNIHA